MKNEISNVLGFLRKLARNNNREWFHAHKDEYLAVKNDVDTLTALLIARISEFDSEARMLTPSDCTYRIYRDTRFSPDKTPYKTHIGIYICPPGGKKSLRCGYYLHLEPGNCLVAGGAWCPDSPTLKRIRRDIYENVDEYLEIINNPEFKKYYQEIGEDLLKTAPKDFPKDWEHISLLRPRSYTVGSPLTDAEMCGPDMMELVLERMHAVKDFNAFLNYAITAGGTLNIR